VILKVLLVFIFPVYKAGIFLKGHNFPDIGKAPMGLLYTNAKILLHAKKAGFSFENVLTIGRLSLFLYSSQLRRLAELYRIDCHEEHLHKQPYAENFIHIFLGAKQVTSIDYSRYENCSIVHDMNHPVDTALHEKYDAVIDGGSLEHVFNFPVALANCMNMVKKGGSLFVFSMANNHCGHGFYQVSPELFYSTFQKQNGYVIQSLLLEEHPFPGGELSRNNKMYCVADPTVVKQRVGIINKNPLMIYLHAVRKNIETIFEHFPIQSDYLSAYASVNVKSQTKSNKTIKAAKRLVKKMYYILPLFFQELIMDFHNRVIGYNARRKFLISNRMFFKRVKL